MPILHAIILGFVQGVTEFLPISSSGFLILIPQLFGWEDQSLAFDTIMHLATLSAVIVAMWSDLKQWRSIFWWIVLATIPILVLGFLLQVVFQIEFRSLTVVGWSFVIWGIVLFIADRFAKGSQDHITQVGWKRALLIGCAQAVALIPGTSRSGITMTAGLFGGLSRKTAASFSFLLSIPTIAVAGGFQVIHLIRYPSEVDLIPMIVGFMVAFVTGFLTIQIFLTFLERNSFKEIALFRVALGLLILALI